MFKTTWKSYFKNNEKNTWKFTKNPGNIMEFCQSEKVGTLNWDNRKQWVLVRAPVSTQCGQFCII